MAIALGKSPAQAAAAAGCSVRHLDGWLAGQRALSATTTLRLREFFGAAWDFITGQTDMLHVPASTDTGEASS